jgi:DNA-binding NarL/FixJ family response regulator
MDEESGTHFLVVEFVEGDSLNHYVPSAPEVVVNLGQQIALALHYAHEHEIIHRDIKPANIKVTPAGQVKIMDLGLALPREAKRVTADGMIIGTPAYLSPEQAQAMALDRRTDIYSLGVVLFEMVTGQLPFSSDDIPALLVQHVKQPPPPPRLINPEIPLALESVILKAMEKSPSRRFQTAEALARALEGSVRSNAGTYHPTLPARAVSSSARAPLRLVLADDHNMLRRTLVSFLSERDDMMVVGEAADGEMALQQTLALQPDVVLLDLNMPIKSGLDVLPEIRHGVPSAKVLVLTGRDEDWYITQALRAGAHGYILKSANETDLIDGIQKVAQGTLVLGRGVAEKVVTGALRGTNEKLTEEERKLMLMVAAGFDNDGISARLDMPMTTLVETMARAMDKLGAKDRHAAALKALRRGDILLDELHAFESD